jgi:hypothetical protein
MITLRELTSFDAVAPGVVARVTVKRKNDNINLEGCEIAIHPETILRLSSPIPSRNLKLV